LARDKVVQIRQMTLANISTFTIFHPYHCSQQYGELGPILITLEVRKLTVNCSISRPKIYYMKIHITKIGLLAHH